MLATIFNVLSVIYLIGEIVCVVIARKFASPGGKSLENSDSISMSHLSLMRGGSRRKK